MVEVTIEARPNGPYVITGTIELRDTNGEVLPTQARTVLCRCGASTKKPFCDGRVMPRATYCAIRARAREAILGQRCLTGNL
jgi:CDGSH-type Zn-finger protein